MSSKQSVGALALAKRYGALALLPAGIIAATTSASAQARDYRYESPRQTYGYSGWDAAPISTWQGVYGGVTFGYGFGSINTGAPIGVTTDNNGGLGGLHLGHNWQQGAMVFGIEGDLSASWASGSSTSPGGIYVSAGTAWLASMRARIGYSFGSALIYATGGAALARTDVSLWDTGWSARGDDILLGWTAGAGLEYKLAPNISTRIEAMHYRFSDKEISTWGGLAPYQADTTTIRAGLTFHLR